MEVKGRRGGVEDGFLECSGFRRQGQRVLIRIGRLGCDNSSGNVDGRQRVGKR